MASSIAVLPAVTEIPTVWLTMILLVRAIAPSCPTDIPTPSPPMLQAMVLWMKPGNQS